MALDTTSVSSGFYPLVVWAASRKAWVLVSSSGGVRGTSFVFLEALIMIGSEES